MDVTFLAKVKADFPNLRFVEGKRFAFRPPRTVVYEPNSNEPLLLLHEVGHFLTGVFNFKTEIMRLKIEVSAWEQAKKLCPKYEVAINDSLIERELDTYRDFLHQKSRCPSCGLTRFQTRDGVFHCPRCDIIS